MAAYILGPQYMFCSTLSLCFIEKKNVSDSHQIVKI